MTEKLFTLEAITPDCETWLRRYLAWQPFLADRRCFNFFDCLYLPQERLVYVIQGLMASGFKPDTDYLLSIHVGKWEK
jgi:hypothetical protein